MAEPNTIRAPEAPRTEPSDAREAVFGYGKGGVPFLLMLFYLAFLVFFVWYTIEYQVPDYLERGPIQPGQASQTDSTATDAR